MADEVEHVDNETPTATDDDVKRMDADTEQNANPGAAVDQQGVRVDPDEGGDDPKSGGTPVHNAPTEDSPHS